MHSEPKITVVMATYNWSSVLPYSISSILRQTRGDFEVRVVGDACTDDSEAVVRAINDPRVHWHNLAKNFGQQGGPNNEGISQARGEYIAYLGHDDLWLPHHLEALIPALEAGAGFAWGLVSFISPHSNTGEMCPKSPRNYRYRMWIPPTGLVHRKDLAQAVGGWRSYHDIATDPECDLLMRIHEAGGLGQFVPRLTALKFPAALRKNVYQDKPCHEQKAWMQKILEGADIEREELLNAALQPRFTNHLRKWRHNLQFILRTRVFGYKRGIFDRRRQFKGLPPKS